MLNCILPLLPLHSNTTHNSGAQGGMAHDALLTNINGRTLLEHILTPFEQYGPRLLTCDDVGQSLAQILTTCQGDSVVILDPSAQVYLPENTTRQIMAGIDQSVPDAIVFSAKTVQQAPGQRPGCVFIRNAANFLPFCQNFVEPISNALQKYAKVATIVTMEPQAYYDLSTPEHIEFFKYYIDSTHVMRLGFGCDHAGLEQKSRFMQAFQNYLPGVELIDFGTHNDEAASYTTIAGRITDALATTATERKIDFGFLFCRSGNGINIAANKLSHANACLVYDAYSFEYSILHNNARLFSIPGRINFSPDKISFICQNLYRLRFEGGRHAQRLMAFNSIPSTTTSSKQTSER